MKNRHSRIALAFAAALATCVPMSAQNASHTQARPVSTNTPPHTTANPSEEPAAMHALSAMSSRLREATSFSFTARIMREEPGTNGQMLDFFRIVRAQVQRPGKMRLEIKSDTSDVNLWCDGKNLTMMPLTGKIYTTMPAEPNLDGTLAMLKSKTEAHTPLVPFLVSDPYSRLADGVQSASEVGFENEGNSRFLHLAFTEPDADWQLWLSGPNEVLPRRMAIVYKKIEGQPRVVVEFSDWNVNAEIPNDAFVFLKPEGSRPVTLEALRFRMFAKKADSEGGKSK